MTAAESATPPSPPQAPSCNPPPSTSSPPPHPEPIRSSDEKHDTDDECHNAHPSSPDNPSNEKQQEQQKPPQRLPRLCIACNAQSPRYKCPQCPGGAYYCSVACNKVHRLTHSTTTTTPSSSSPHQSNLPPTKDPYRILLDHLPTFHRLLARYPSLVPTLKRIYTATLPPDTGDDIRGGLPFKLAQPGARRKQWDADDGLRIGAKALREARVDRGERGDGVREWCELVMYLLSPSAAAASQEERRKRRGGGGLGYEEVGEKDVMSLTRWQVEEEDVRMIKRLRVEEGGDR